VVCALLPRGVRVAAAQVLDARRPALVAAGHAAA